MNLTTIAPVSAAALFVLLAGVPAYAKDAKYVLRIDGITCPFCVAASEKALRHMDGVRAVSSNLEAGTITLCADEARADLSDAQLARVFRGQGFTYRGKEKRGTCRT